MKMFGILTVQRAGPQPGIVIRNTVTASAEVATRTELYERMLATLPGE